MVDEWEENLVLETAFQRTEQKIIPYVQRMIKSKRKRFTFVDHP